MGFEVARQKKLPSEFLVELKPFLWSEDDLTAQDSSGDTAVHTAIRHENWHIASVLGLYLYRSPLHDNFRTNHQGMNEYELGIHLYGAAGRAHERMRCFLTEIGLAKVTRLTGTLGSIEPCEYLGVVFTSTSRE